MTNTTTNTTTNTGTNTGANKSTFFDIVDFAPAVDYLRKNIDMSDNETRLIEHVVSCAEDATNAFFACTGENALTVDNLTEYARAYNKALKTLRFCCDNTNNKLFQHLHSIVLDRCRQLTEKQNSNMKAFYKKYVYDANPAEAWTVFEKCRNIRIYSVFVDEEGDYFTDTVRHCPTLHDLFVHTMGNDDVDNLEIKFKTLCRNLTRYHMTAGGRAEGCIFGYSKNEYEYTKAMTTFFDNSDFGYFGRHKGEPISKQVEHITDLISGGGNKHKFNSIGVAHTADAVVKKTKKGHSESRAKTVFYWIEHELFFKDDRQLKLHKDFE